MAREKNETENKLSWCIKKPNGIELIEPNENLCKKYFNEADSTLITLESIKKNKMGCHHGLLCLL